MFGKTLEKFRSAKAEVQARLYAFLIATLGFRLASALMPKKRVGEPDVFDTIVELSIAVVVVGVLFPIALPYILTASFGTGTLAQTLTTLFQTLVSIVAIIVVIMLFLKYRKA